MNRFACGGQKPAVFCILNYSGSKFIKCNLYKIRIESEKIVSETGQFSNTK